MIAVNLLPRGANASAGAPRGPSARDALVARLARIGAVVGDPYLVGAVAATLVGIGAVGAMHWTTQRETAALAERETVALADSSRYAAAIAARRRAEGERDAVNRQLAVITQIDSARYVWAHVLDEVSRSLPPYTWLTSVQQTSAPPAPPAAPKPDSAAARSATAPTAASAQPDTAPATPSRMTFRVVGQTVDIQALTLFMRDLEASPFLDRIQLVRSEAVLADGKEVTEFTLDGAYRTAPLAVLRTQTLAIPVMSAGR
ncbi:MAG TPA: PilN domain-containing protein [Gemmatirosa sp.]|nr:PilN domain-containing protein [Gemmatirosa sp.]